jgi:hypothetical protein
MAVDVILIQDTRSSIYDTANVLGKTITELYLWAKALAALRLHGSNIKLNPCIMQICYLLKLSGKQIQRKPQCR